MHCNHNYYCSSRQGKKVTFLYQPRSLLPYYYSSVTAVHWKYSKLQRVQANKVSGAHNWSTPAMIRSNLWHWRQMILAVWHPTWCQNSNTRKATINCKGLFNLNPPTNNFFSQANTGVDVKLTLDTDDIEEQALDASPPLHFHGLHTPGYGWSVHRTSLSGSKFACTGPPWIGLFHLEATVGQSS